MPRVRTPLLAIALVALASGCAARMDHAGRYRGHDTLRIVNATTAPICEVYVNQRDEHLWGKTWIAQPIAPGEHVDLAVRPDDYMLRAGHCDGRTAVVAYRIALDGDLAVVIHDGYPPASDGQGLREVAYPSWLRMRAPGTGKAGVEFSVHNRCARDLRVVLGGDPSERSGAPSTLPAHASLRYFAAPGTRLWLVDDRYRPLASTALRGDTDELDVSPTCDGFTSA